MRELEGPEGMWEEEDWEGQPFGEGDRRKDVDDEAMMVFLGFFLHIA